MSHATLVKNIYQLFVANPIKCYRNNTVDKDLIPSKKLSKSKIILEWIQLNASFHLKKYYNQIDKQACPADPIYIWKECQRELILKLILEVAQYAASLSILNNGQILFQISGTNWNNKGLNNPAVYQLSRDENFTVGNRKDIRFAEFIKQPCFLPDKAHELQDKIAVIFAAIKSDDTTIWTVPLGQKVRDTFKIHKARMEKVGP